MQDPARAVIDWARQKVDFEPDGSLRDIYVQRTTVDDWRAVVALILGGNYRARIERGDGPGSVPADFESLFAGDDRRVMTFSIGAVELSCYFFARDEIELSFAPGDVTERALPDLLGFMAILGQTTGKRVIMTPESCPQSPIFVYDASEQQLRWCRPA